ncbi:MAG TPA: hypothetical protein VME69_04415 [Methylocella sp.]|nr:hypothetical protein [Methylocella sp.]
MRTFVAVLIGVALSCPISEAFPKAEDVPRFDISRTCAEAGAFAGSDKDLAYRGCLKDENDAKAELKRKWSHFKAQDRRDCVAQGANPMPSYVEILTCLEMSQEASELYNPNGTARARTKPQGAIPALSAPLSGEPLPPAPPSDWTAPSGPPSEPLPPLPETPREPTPGPAGDLAAPDLGGPGN